MSEYIIGQWPNVALVPGTHTHAVTGEHVKQPEHTRIGCSRIADGPDAAALEQMSAEVDNEPQDATEWIIPINENTMRVLSDVCHESQDGSECDTRKQLEAEIARKACTYEKTADTWHPELMECTYDDVLHWLNRQAAITEREWLEGKTHIFGMTFEEVCDLQAKVEELTAELEEWNKLAEGIKLPEYPVTQFQPKDGDSRERLRADVYKGFSDVNLPEQIRDVLRARVHAWLVRQALITEEQTRCRMEDWKSETERLTAERDKLNEDCSALDKCCNTLEEELKRVRAERNIYRWNLGELENNAGREIAELLDENGVIEVFEEPLGKRRLVTETQRQLEKLVEELTAERDELQAAIDTMNNGQFYSMYKAKCKECEQLKNRLTYKNEKLKALCEELNAEY